MTVLVAVISPAAAWVMPRHFVEALGLHVALIHTRKEWTWRNNS
jgi:hypothetical protein